MCQPKISRNFAGKFCLQQNLANSNISCVFGSARFIYVKIRPKSLIRQLFESSRRHRNSAPFCRF